MLDLHTITWNQYLEYLNIMSNDALVETEKIVYAYAYFNNLNYFDIRNNNLDELNGIAEFISNFNDKPKNIDFEGFVYNNEEYLITKNFSHLKLGQWIDCDTIFKRFKNSIHKAIPYFIAIMCLKKDEIYSYEFLEKKAQEFYNLPAYTVLSFVNFFLNIEKRSQNDTQIFSRMRMRVLELNRQPLPRLLSRLILLIDGVGMRLFVNWLAMIFLKLTILRPTTQLDKYLHI